METCSAPLHRLLFEWHVFWQGREGGFTLYMKFHQKLNRKMSPEPLSTWWCKIQFGVNYPFKAERNEDDESSLCNMQCFFKKTKYRRSEDPAVIRFYLIPALNKLDSGGLHHLPQKTETPFCFFFLWMDQRPARDD